MIIDRISSWNHLRCVLGVEARGVENPNRRMEMAYIIRMYEGYYLVLDETRPTSVGCECVFGFITCSVLPTVTCNFGNGMLSLTRKKEKEKEKMKLGLV